MCTNISDTAKIGLNPHIGNNVIILDDVEIGDNVSLGNNVVIYPGTRIAGNVSIQDNSVLGKQPKPASTSTLRIDEPLPPLEIGDDCNIGTSVVIFAGTTLGNGATIGDMASVREKCRIDHSVMVGQRATVENDVIIGAYVKIQTNAYITAYTTIEEHVFIAPHVVTTNDNFMGRTAKRFGLRKGPVIQRAARVGGGSIILPGVTIGEEAFVAAGSVVTKDVPRFKLVMGIPARVVRDVPGEELLGREEKR